MSAHPRGDLSDRPESAGIGSPPALRQEVLAENQARLASQLTGIQYNYFSEAGTQAEPVVSIAPPLGQRDDRLPLRGRDQLLTILADADTNKKVRVIHGMGGCGKTRLAIELAWQAQQRGVEVWWVSATDKARLVAGMRAVGRRVGISDDELRRGEAADLVWRSLGNKKEEWLLVIDGADDLQILAASGSPVGHGTGWLRPLSLSAGSVVVTSRDGRPSNWGPWCTFHLVGMLAGREAARVLTDHTRGNAELGTENDALVLARRLGGLPLALKIAGSFLAESVAVPAAFSASDLFRTYNEYRQAIEHGLLDTAFPIPVEGSTELTDERARGLIGRTWELTLDSLQARQMPEARGVLRLLASMADAPIPHLLLLKPDILSHSYPFEGITGHRLWHVLNTLAGFGLIDLATGVGPLSVTRLHPLVRDTSRPRRNANPHERDAYLILAAKLIHQATKDAGTPRDPVTWQSWQLLSPHALYIFESVNSTGVRADDDSLCAAYAAGMAARYQAEQGLYGTAETVHRAVLAIQLQMLGTDEPNTLATKHEIARMKTEQGDHTAADVEFRDILAARLRVLGADHPDTLSTRHEIAQLMEARDDHVAAEAEFRDVLAARLRVLGADHPDTLTTQQNVALVMAEQGDHAGAEAEYRGVLTAQVRVLGADHPDTLTTRHSIAYVMTVQGDHAGAEAQYRDVLAAEVRVLGADHPETLATRHEIARTRAMQGDHVGAEAQYRDVLAAKLSVRGADHPSTLITRSCFAEVRADQGDHVAAEAEYRQVLAAQQRVLGADHRDALTTRHQVAWELAAQDKYAEAEAEYRQVLAARVRVLGADHPETLITRHEIARTRAMQGDHVGAEAQYRDVLAAKLSARGADHPSTLITRCCIAELRAYQGDHVAAEAEYRQVLAAQWRVLGADHRDVLTTWYQVAAALAAQDKHAEAEAEYRQVLGALQGSLGADHPDALTTWYQVAWELAAQDKHAEAEAEYRQVLAAQQRVLGAEHNYTADTRKGLATVLVERGRQLIYPSLYQLLTTREA